MDSIKRSNKALRKDISDVRSGIWALHESRGAAFYRFRDLLAEIQNMIWKAALNSHGYWSSKDRYFMASHESHWTPEVTLIKSFLASLNVVSARFETIAHGPLFKPLIRKDHSAVRQACRLAREQAKLGIYDPNKYRMSYPINFL
jgi:hypothetical protein